MPSLCAYACSLDVQQELLMANGADALFLNLAQAMNRSLANVILGGYSITRKEVEEQGEALEHQTTDIAGAVDAITNARSVIIVPGYGLAVASAQYAIADLVKTLTSKDIKIRLAAITACCAQTLCQLHVRRWFGWCSRDLQNHEYCVMTCMASCLML